MKITTTRTEPADFMACTSGVWEVRCDGRYAGWIEGQKGYKHDEAFQALGHREMIVEGYIACPADLDADTKTFDVSDHGTAAKARKAAVAWLASLDGTL